MLFYPGAKFSESEISSESSSSATFIRNDLPNEVAVTCRFTSDGKGVTVTKTVPVEAATVWQDDEADKRERAAKIAAGAAALYAGKRLFKHQPSWGMLTGIRPAKFASDLMARGMSPTSTRSTLTHTFMVTPRKSMLAVDIAKYEQKIVQLAGDNNGAKTCSVYVSIPFCPSRCSYCSFVSYTSGRLLALIPDYLEQLCRDIVRTFETIRSLGMHVQTIYIGGGTPTTLDAAQLEKLLDTISGELKKSKSGSTECNSLECNSVESDLLEFTLEAGRPDTITREKLDIAAKYGVTRISINPQTLNDDVLAGVGRRHTVDDFYRAYEMAKESGIKYVNTDLIAGLPGDSFESFTRTVDKITKLDPDNITLHTFCVKKAADILRVDTEIYRQNAHTTVQMVDYSQLHLKSAGYVPYYIYRQKNTIGNLENVGYAKKGSEGIYNVMMMEEVQSIFAVGAGAVTKLVRYDRDGKKQIKRIFAPKYPYEYLSEKYLSTVSDADREIAEFFESN